MRERPPESNPQEERPQTPEGGKPAWQKPLIRASGTFEMQALACAPSQQREGFPPCMGGTS
jgi:hypothetical protein